MLLDLKTITENSIINYIKNGSNIYKDLNKLDSYNYYNIIDKLYDIDLDECKKNMAETLISIESTLWKKVDIMYPNFYINNFNNHYTDIFIEDKYGNKKTIYQYHNPLWYHYFKKAKEFNI